MSSTTAKLLRLLSAGNAGEFRFLVTADGLNWRAVALSAASPSASTAGPRGLEAHASGQTSAPGGRVIADRAVEAAGRGAARDPVETRALSALAQRRTLLRAQICGAFAQHSPLVGGQVRRRGRRPALLNARAPLVEPLLALRGRQRRPSLRCCLQNQVFARLSGRGHDSVLAHPSLDPIADRLLLVRVEVVVPVLQGFFDVVFVIATVRMVVDPNPEIIIAYQS